MKRYVNNKEVNAVLVEASKRGWVVETGGRHLKVRHPDYGLVTVSITTTCYHAPMNIKKDLERKERQYHANKKCTV